MSALNRLNVQLYSTIVDEETLLAIRSLLNGSVAQQEPRELFFGSIMRKFAFNISLRLAYGNGLNENSSDLYQEIVEVEAEVLKLRSHTGGNLQDFIPLLRIGYILFPWLGRRPASIRARRDKYMNELLLNLQQKIDEHKDEVCIVGNVLKDIRDSERQEPNAHIVSREELDSICLSMVSAGLDGISTTLIVALGMLSDPVNGKRVQDAAYADIMAHSPLGLKQAWDTCPYEFKSPYITALVKESLRYSSVISLSLPRETIAPIRYKGAVIPAGTMLILNTYTTNRDEKYFENPYEFLPERYLNWNKRTEHFSFGAGLRMCGGYNLANKVLYVLLCRIICMFEVRPSDTHRMDPDLLAGQENSRSLVMAPEEFKLKFVLRSDDLVQHVR